MKASRTVQNSISDISLMCVVSAIIRRRRGRVGLGFVSTRDHGPAEGHRIAHLWVPGSPYGSSGYNLRFAGQWVGRDVGGE